MNHCSHCKCELQHELYDVELSVNQLLAHQQLLKEQKKSSLFDIFLFGRPKGSESFIQSVNGSRRPSHLWMILLSFQIGRLYLEKRRQKTIQPWSPVDSRCTAANKSCFDHFLTLVSFTPFPDRVNHDFIFNIVKMKTPHQHHHPPAIPTERLGLQCERERAPPCGEATAIHLSDGRRDASIATVRHSNSLFEWS